IVSPSPDMASKSNVACRLSCMVRQHQYSRHGGAGTGAPINSSQSATSPCRDLLPHKAFACQRLHRLRVTLCGIGSLDMELEVGGAGQSPRRRMLPSFFSRRATLVV